MKTYFYSNTKNKETESEYTVYEVKTINRDINTAEEKALAIAKKHNDTLAGGLFTSNSLPYNFKDNYTIIKVPFTTKIIKDNTFDKIGYIIAFESGELSQKGILDLFSNLIKTGECWTLQGFYGRTAQSLIDNGYISAQGKILKDIE